MAETRSRITPLRVVLALMAVGTAEIGIWAEFAPRQFYNSFPGAGRHWVSADGPYNEHLVRDFGALNLAIAVVTLIAVVQLTVALARAVAVAHLVYYVPHLVYHLRHLNIYSSSDKIGNISALGFAILLPVVALVLTRPRRSAS